MSTIRKTISNILFLFCSTTLLYGQHSYGSKPADIHAIIQQLKEENTDSLHFALLNQVYQHYITLDISKASAWVDEATALAKKTTDPDIQISCYSLIADYKLKTGRHLDAKYCYNKALEVSLQTRDSTAEADALYNLGTTHNFMGDYIKALEYYHESMSIAKAIDDQSRQAEIVAHIGVLYYIQQDHKNAIRYLENALSLNTKLNNKAAIAENLSDLGKVYHDLSKDTQNDSHLHTSVEYYKKALQLIKTTNNRNYKSGIKANLGIVYGELGQFDIAMKYLRNSLKISIQMQDLESEATCYNYIAEVYYLQKNYQEAKNFFSKAYVLGSSINSKTTILTAYGGLAKVCEQKKNYKEAYIYHVKFKAAQDSLYSIEKNSRFNTLMAIYEAEKKEQQIKNLQKDTALQKLELKQQKTYKVLSIIAASIFALLSITVLWLYRQLHHSKLSLEQTNANLLSYQKELSTLNTMKDRFFATIAHDLRGGLTSFEGIGSVIRNHMNKGRTDRIIGVAEKIDKSAHSLNTMLDSLLSWAITQLGNAPFNPETINLNTLVSSIAHSFHDTASAKNILFAINIPDHTLVSADPNGLSVVLRNLLSNAFRFTPAGGRIGIFAQDNEDKVYVEVSDSGVGIHPKKINSLFKIDGNKSTPDTSGVKGAGLGLVLCKEFIQLHKGEIQVKSELDKGSTFYFFLHKPDKN